MTSAFYADVFLDAFLSICDDFDISLIATVIITDYMTSYFTEHLIEETVDHSFDHAPMFDMKVGSEASPVSCCVWRSCE